MNSNSSICCIGLAVVIITTSFAAAVGFQTVKSNSAINSPLFVVRSKRAVDEENKVLNCKYVGKGITLPFPRRDDKAIMVQKVIDRISKMDDKKLERFIAFIINHARKDYRFNGVNPDRIREAFNMLRYSDKPIQIYNVDPENRTFGYEPFCIIKSIILIIIGFIFWCYPPLATGLVCGTRDCPKTIRKLFKPGV